MPDAEGRTFYDTGGDAEPLILGTAGHIDHGKTALIRALTGVDCDRLPEERARGITIELGFAPLDLPSGRRLGVVDVPGHEKLVRTMVAGATGIDLVLLVVAADEGIMPQTREHLAICELLGIARGAVALTKIDAVDPELVELARLEVEERLRGSSLAAAPVIPVSAQRGDGLDALRDALDRVAAGAPPRTPRDGPTWLPVDRVFTMRGFGTVVTGTLRGSGFAVGEGVEVLTARAGRRLGARIRGLQVHGVTRARAPAGSRCALNLQGVDVSSVPRGSVVATPGRLDDRRGVDVELTLLSGAPRLEDGSEWMVHVGTSERRARLRLLEGGALEPGGRTLAALRFARPLPVFEGERFILRGFSRIQEGGWTIGGGRVLDAAPLRRRRSRAARLADLRAMASGDRKAALAARLERAGLRGVREQELRRAVVSTDGIDGVRVGADLWLGRRAFDSLVELCAAAVARHHAERPVDPWVGLAAACAKLPEEVPEEAARAALEAGAQAGRLESSGSGYRRPGHSAHLSDPRLADRVLAELEPAGLAPESLTGLARRLGRAPGELRPALEHLVAQGRLVRVRSDWFFARDAVDALRDRVVGYLRAHGEIDPAAYKTLTGQTRKHTVPLMEFFDAERLTLRRGNLRVLRGAPTE